jgi:glycosyltransferase involved in cell wall biosynthesis
MDTRLSVITISKDDPIGLERSLVSASEQSCRDFEHILVLAGSSCDVQLPNDPRLRVVLDGKPGISNSLNAGVQAAHGEWVQFLNGGDSFADAGSLQAMMDHAGTGVEMVCSFAKVLSRSFTIPRQPLQPGHGEFIYASHQASLYRKHLFDRHGLFDPRMRIHMDLEWLMRLPENLPYVFVDKETILFDPRGVSATRVVASSVEETRILWNARGYRVRALSVLFLRLPFRVIRREIRRWLGR